MPSKNTEKNREAVRKHYHNNKEYYKLKNKARQDKLYSEMRNYKEANPCVDCGSNYTHYVMEFDHLEPHNGKRVGTYANRGSAKKMWEEINKCDLVCANCHSIRTHYRRLASLSQPAEEHA